MTNSPRLRSNRPTQASSDDRGGDLRSLLEQLLEPLKETAIETARLVKHLGMRLDAFSLDLARDLGSVTRDAQAFAGSARDQAATL